MCDHSFYSVDNLVELGLGMAVARTMVGYFNQNMNIVMSQPDYSIQNVHVSFEGHDIGPLNEKEISQLFQEHKLHADTLAWMPGMTAWKSIEQMPAILKIIALAPSTNP